MDEDPSQNQKLDIVKDELEQTVSCHVSSHSPFQSTVTFCPLDEVQPGPQPHTQCNREKVGPPNIYGRGASEGRARGEGPPAAQRTGL